MSRDYHYSTYVELHTFTSSRDRKNIRKTIKYIDKNINLITNKWDKLKFLNIKRFYEANRKLFESDFNWLTEMKNSIDRRKVLSKFSVSLT
mgnify:CR=1 FL=1